MKITRILLLLAGFVLVTITGCKTPTDDSGKAVEASYSPDTTQPVHGWVESN